MNTRHRWAAKIFGYSHAGSNAGINIVLEDFDGTIRGGGFSAALVICAETKIVRRACLEIT